MRACQHMDKWHQRVNMNWKNQISTYHPALPKGCVQFYYANFYSVKKTANRKGLPSGQYTSVRRKQVCCMMTSNRLAPLKEPPWIHTVRSAAVEVQVSTPPALCQHLPSLHSTIQLKCFFSLWEPLTISWFRVHGHRWELLGPSTLYLYNSGWFSSDKTWWQCKSLKWQLSLWRKGQQNCIPILKRQGFACTQF